MWATYLIIPKLPHVNYHPNSEHSPKSGHPGLLVGLAFLLRYVMLFLLKCVYIVLLEGFHLAGFHLKVGEASSSRLQMKFWLSSLLPFHRAFEPPIKTFAAKFDENVGARVVFFLPWPSSQGDQGSMLWSQFFAIFDNFRRRKLAFFSKTNVMIKFWHNVALFWVKNAIFLLNFSTKIF
jgi:hypothetical protein